MGAKWDQITGDGGRPATEKIVEAEDAIAVIHDGDTVASTGYGGNGTPDQLFVALEKRFLETGAPLGLTFKAFPIKVALIRATTADPDGNLTTERESLALENLALAIAARNWCRTRSRRSQTRSASTTSSRSPWILESWAGCP